MWLLLPVAHAWSLCGLWTADRPIDLCLPAPDAPGAPCDGPWADAALDALDAWSDLQGAPVFVPTVGGAAPAPTDGASAIGWMDQATFQTLWGPISSASLAVEVNELAAPCGVITEADLVLFTDWAWSLDRADADRTGAIAFGETFAHEVGHAVGHQHEDARFTLMNSLDHVPSLLPLPHADEVAGMVANIGFHPGSFREVAVLPYRGDGTWAVPPTLLAGRWARAGEAIVVGDVLVQNLGTAGPIDITYDTVLSRDGVVDPQDVVLGGLTFPGVPVGGEGTVLPSALTLPALAEGTWRVLGVADRTGRVAERDEANTIDLGAIEVDALELLGVQGRAGQRGAARVALATPGATVHVAWGTSAGSAPVPGCPDARLPLAAPRLYGSGVADPAGVATVAGTLPAATRGRTVTVVAVDAARCTVSPAVRIRP